MNKNRIKALIRKLCRKYGLPVPAAKNISCEHGTATVKPWHKAEIERLFAGKN